MKKNIANQEQQLIEQPNLKLINWDPSKGNPNTYMVSKTKYEVDWPAIQASIKEYDGRQYFEFTKADIQKTKKLSAMKKVKSPVTSKGVVTSEDAIKKTKKSMSKTLKRESKERAPLHGEYRCNYHVCAVESLDLSQAITLLHLKGKKNKDAYWFQFNPQPLTVRIQYPLSRTVEFQIPPYKVVRDETSLDNRSTRMDPGYVLWVIAKIYKQIYEKYEHYGIWGHAMEDLYFEGLNINWDGRTDLYIGS